ncbi:MAG: hypothetical protein WBC29_01005 [Candidatus Moraniibacteriota bacterium]
MAVASVAVNGRDNFALEQAAKEERMLFREQRERLRQAQQQARITQEEAMLEEEECESGSLDVERAERVSIFSYSAPLIVACFKDFLDFTVVLALPGIATVISMCADILILFLLFFPKHRYRLTTNARLIIIDTFILMGLIPLEGIAFPFNLLPFTVAAVGMIYTVDKKFVAARNSKRFDRKKMKANLTGVIRQAADNRKSSDKSRVSERMQSTWDTPEYEATLGA